MNEFNLNPQKLIPTAKVEIAYDNLRNNIILFTSLKKFLEKKKKNTLSYKVNLKNIKIKSIQVISRGIITFNHHLILP